MYFENVLEKGKINAICSCYLVMSTQGQVAANVLFCVLAVLTLITLERTRHWLSINCF